MQQPNFTLVHDVDEPRPASNGAGTTPPEKGGPASAKQRPRRVLPTPRITLKKQFELLRGYAVGSDFGAKATTYSKASELAGLHPNTGTLCSMFFYDTGLVTKADGGSMPAPEVVAFARAYEWDQDGATAKLWPVIKRAWFSAALEPRLKMRPLSEEEALRILAEEAHATPEHRPQLKICLDYMEAARVVVRSGDQIRLSDGEPAAGSDAGERATSAADGDGQPAAERAAPQASFFHDRPEPKRSGNGTVPPSPQNAEAAISFQFSVNMTMNDLKRLSPEQVREMFAGLATLIAAQNSLSG